MKKIFFIILGSFAAMFLLSACGLKDTTKAKLADSEEAYYDALEDIQANSYRIVLMRGIPTYQAFVPANADDYFNGLTKTNATVIEAMLSKAKESWDDDEVLRTCAQVDSVSSLLNKKDSMYMVGIAKKIDAAGASQNLQYQFILEDSKAGYFATLGRTSWDERTDINTNIDYIYAERSVDEGTYREFLVFDEGDKPLADAYTSGWTDTKLGYRNMFSEQYKAIAGEYSLAEKWPNDKSNACEIWVQGVRAKCYQKFAVEINGETYHTDWIQVPEEAYESVKDGLGMAVYSKTKSQKETEAIVALTPPNMQYVGDKDYGQWNGSAWTWNDEARFCRDLADAIDQATYDLYVNSYRPYGYDFYGMDASGNRRFGLNSTHTSSFKSTTYVQSHPQSLTPAQASIPAKPVGNVRTAGRSARGGGPGGGGK